ncbi:MAG: hypothetical protein IJ317_02785 [Clostridia bacterium]|nr:hypothetical protein [Clostridia bacterium]
MDVLSKQENEVMNAVYTLCEGRGVCLVSPEELVNLLPPKKKYTEQQLEKILGALALDDYFQLLSSERKGEKMYVISLHANGYAYKRSFVQQKRDLIFKLGWAVASAVIAFLVGLLLKRIF